MDHKKGIRLSPENIFRLGGEILHCSIVQGSGCCFGENEFIETEDGFICSNCGEEAVYMDEEMWKIIYFVDEKKESSGVPIWFERPELIEALEVLRKKKLVR